MIIWRRAKRRQFTAFPSRRSPINERSASAARKGTPGTTSRPSRGATTVSRWCCGGALGAYQIGVYQALAEAGCEPKTIFERRTVPTSPENTRVDYELLSVSGFSSATFVMRFCSTQMHKLIIIFHNKLT
jgi:hypothetical protein